MAPGYANIFMGVLEKNMLATAPQGKTPLFYKRFIDDVFGIWLGIWLFGEEALLAFFAQANKALLSINFTYRFGTEVDGMDSSLSIRGDSISSGLYTKPADTHQYLLPSSDHPPHVHKHLPYGLGIRLRAIVSDDTWLEHHLSELTAFLTARGYPKPAVEEQLDRVRASPRERVLNYTKRRLRTNRTALVCSWNTRLPAFSELLRDSFPILQSNEHLRSVFDFPFVSYRRPGNLRDLVLLSTEQSRKARAPQPDGTYPCDRPRCKTCERVHTIATLPYRADRSISIRGHHSCQSASVVYLVSCTQAQCEAVYIGEMGCTLRERMNGHRSSIKNKEDTPVAVHFTHRDHSWRVTVLERAPTDTVQRRLLENLWINMLRLFTVLNRDDGLGILVP